MVNEENKIKQIAIRFDSNSYNKISRIAKMEHRGIGEFVRHAVLVYVENLNKDQNRNSDKSDT